MSEADDFQSCLLLNTVMAARAMTRRYDERLSRFGVSVAQFSVMMVLRHGKGETLSALAERIAMDRTTLSRNIDHLAAKGLVSKTPARKGNARICALTPAGDALLDQLIPLWRNAQKELGNLLAGKDVSDMVDSLRRITAG